MILPFIKIHLDEIVVGWLRMNIVVVEEVVYGESV